MVARRPLAFTLPEAYSLRLRLRGAATSSNPGNKLEVKLVDPSGANVWRWQQDPFHLTGDWQTLTIKGSEIEFAWGPAGGGAPSEVGAVELALVAGPGGRGALWIADICLDDRTAREPPRVSASSARAGHAADCVLDGRTETAWYPKPGDGDAWLALDFRAAREYGGLVLRWSLGRLGTRGFLIQASDDGDVWRDLYSAPDSAGPVSYVYLPKGESRHLRIRVSGEPVPGLAAVEVQPYAFSRDIDEFFHQIAARSERGRYPKWLCREQSYWTPVDIPDGFVPALINEEGLLEIQRGSWSLEPFLFADGALITWADAAVSQILDGGDLPIPSSQWRALDLALTTTAFAAGAPGQATLNVRYRVENLGPASRRVRLFVALRPFQVSPPWQRFGDIGGIAAVGEVDWRDGALWVGPGSARLSPARVPADGAPAEARRAVIPLRTPMDSAPPSSIRARSPTTWPAASCPRGIVSSTLSVTRPPPWPSTWT